MNMTPEEIQAAAQQAMADTFEKIRIARDEEFAAAATAAVAAGPTLQWTSRSFDFSLTTPVAYKDREYVDIKVTVNYFTDETEPQFEVKGYGFPLTAKGARHKGQSALWTGLPDEVGKALLQSAEIDVSA